MGIVAAQTSQPTHARRPLEDHRVPDMSTYQRFRTTDVGHMSHFPSALSIDNVR